MDWGDEQYVKLYRRDTYTWLAWPWQARALLGPLLKKLTGAGILEFGRGDVYQATALMVLLPIDVVKPGVDAMLADGTLELAAGALIMTNYLAAQEATKTERLKKKDQRERQKDVFRAQHRGFILPPVPSRPEVSRTTTSPPPPPPPAHHQPSPAQPTTSSPPPPAGGTTDSATDGVQPDGPVVVKKAVAGLVLEAQSFAEWISSVRQSFHVRAEGGLPTHKRRRDLDFVSWFIDRRGEGHTFDDIADAYQSYLRDEHFSDRHHPTVVFMAQGVYETRLPKNIRKLEANARHWSKT